MNRHHFLAVLAGLACTVPAWSQTAAAAPRIASPWPSNRPVVIVVPYATGGTVDAIARATAKGITTATGQPVVIENLPGADGVIGTRKVMDAKPDGYTLLLQVPALTISKYVANLKDFEPLAQLEPVSNIAETPLLVVTHPGVPAQNFRELVDHCRKAAEPCSLGTPETTVRVLGKRLSAEAGGIPNLIQVPYKGTSPIVTDIVGGRITMTFLNYPGVASMYQAGKLKIIGVMDSKRSPAAPNAPTLAEAGFPQFEAVNWFGLFAPKGVPAPMMNAIAATLQSLRGDADLQKLSAGAALVLNSPAQFGEQVRRVDHTWAELAKRYPIQ